MTKFVDKLIKEMEEYPEDFEYDNGEFCLVHTPSRMKVWIANGFFFYDTYPKEGTFSLLDKIKFSIAFRVWGKVAEEQKQKDLIKRFKSSD